MARSKVEQRVFVHVGVPKSGTTFLQTSLLENRKRLLGDGVLYPGGEERMFLAAVDVRGTHKAWGRKRSEVTGRWDDLCRRVRKHPGVSVISHELLAGAAPREVAAAMSMLKGLDVHVVVSARDPARQATAEWQEGIKHGRRLTFEEFRHRVLDGGSETDYARKFRSAQDLPAVLARWSASLRADHVHVVCCPPASAGREVLWERFAAAIGFDPAAFPAAGSQSANQSLGTAEIDLLRRVNLALDKQITQPDYGLVVKQLYAASLLRAGTSAPPVVPVDMHDDLRVTGERWVKEIDKAGYVVHGRLEDLLPVAPDHGSPHPDLVDCRAQLQTATAATADLLMEVQRGRREIHRLQTADAKHEKRQRKLRGRLRRALGD
jgi:hypothetical protein